MITEAEVAKHLKQLELDLEAEWVEKKEAQKVKKDRRDRKHEERAEAAKEVALTKLTQNYTEQFWQEKGYVLHTDSRGHREWMPKERHERRLRYRERSLRKARTEKYKRLGYLFTATLVCALVGYFLAS